jgi:DNA invertase Pin-like site-specific DNA recombinase
LKAVIYARYSSERQTEQSIEGQIRDCTEFAEENEITVVGTYIDRAKTGTNDRREEFQKMLRDSKRRNFQAVIVWKIDRFGRNREEIAKNKAILRMNGVSVLYAKEHIPDGPEGIILESVLEGLAEYYSAELRQKIVRGMRESAYKAQFNGSGLATGYTTDKDRKFHIDPDGAKVVRLIFKSYDDGMKVAEILRMLHDKEIRTMKGNEFTHYGITRILRNRQYIGEYRWHDIVIPDGVPQIIEKELFERVQAEMDKNKKAPARARGGDVSFLLTSKIFCGHCRGTMVGDSGTGKSGNMFYYYTCRKRKTKRACKKKSVRKEWLEREVAMLTAATVLQGDVIEYIAGRVVEIQRKECDDKSMLNYYKKQLSETNVAIKNIMKAIEAGVFTDTTRDRLLELETARDDIQVEIEKENIARPVIKREQVIYFLNRFKGGDIDDPAYQKEIIDMFVNKVFLYDDKIIITYNYSGEKNEITADIVEEAAEEAVSEAVKGCSDKLPLTPPIFNNSNTFIFFLPGGVFGIVSKIADKA